MPDAVMVEVLAQLDLLMGLMVFQIVVGSITFIYLYCRRD